MKTAEFERWLKKQGIKVYREGKGHKILINPATGQKAALSRSTGEIPRGTQEAIKKELGLK